MEPFYAADTNEGGWVMTEVGEDDEERWCAYMKGVTLV